METVNGQTGEVLMSALCSSELIADLAGALAIAQASIGTVTKDKTAKLGDKYSYKYADLASCLDAVREPLAANGLALVQGASGHGNAITVTTRLLHKSGQWIESGLTLTAKDTTPQAIGSAITYARRYGLSALIGLAADDDDGQAAGKGTAQAKPAAVQKPVEVPPDGYAAWLAALEGVADSGPEPLREAWQKSSTVFRAYITKHNMPAWEALKERAAQQVPA